MPEQQLTHEKEMQGGLSRRTLCAGIGSIAALGVLGGLKLAPSTAVVRPPGGQDEALFLSRCIRCDRCLESCPQGVIRPMHIEDGLVGVRTPMLRFSSNYCDFCESSNNGVPLCAHVCPTEALHVAPSARAQEVVLGVARVNTDWCLAYKVMGCKYCSEACPHKAIVLDERERPHVVDDLCNGCGACESVCVSLESGSIAAGATRTAITVQPLNR